MIDETINAHNEKTRISVLVHSRLIWARINRSTRQRFSATTGFDVKSQQLTAATEY